MRRPREEAPVENSGQGHHQPKDEDRDPVEIRKHCILYKKKASYMVGIERYHVQ